MLVLHCQHWLKPLQPKLTQHFHHKQNLLNDVSHEKELKPTWLPRPHAWFQGGPFYIFMTKIQIFVKTKMNKTTYTKIRMKCSLDQIQVQAYSLYSIYMKLKDGKMLYMEVHKIKWYYVWTFSNQTISHFLLVYIPYAIFTMTMQTRCISPI